MSRNKENRLHGLFIGGVVGDAFGSPYEFKRLGSYTITEEMEYNGVFNLPAGSFTDDSSMMLCLAQSLIDMKRFYAPDQMSKYAKWMLHGYMSSNDEKGCFDVGRQTKTAILEYIRDVHKDKQTDGYYGSVQPIHSGNGGIMRLAPIMIYFHKDVDGGLVHARNSSRVTHGSPECIECAWLMAFVVFMLLDGRSKDAVSKRMMAISPSLREEQVRNIAAQTFKKKESRHIFTSGYVIHTLEAALWAFFKTETFKEGMLLLAEMGRDVDTVCCVYGQIAGAYYGYTEIPAKWIAALQKKDLVISVCCKLVDESFNRPSKVFSNTSPTISVKEKKDT